MIGVEPKKNVAFLGLLSLWTAVSGHLLAFDEPNQNDRIAHFESKVRPILIAKCLECHSNKERSGGLSLESREGWLHGGDSGPAIELADWERSILWQAVQYKNPRLQMPPDGKLDPKELNTIQVWLSTGAVDPRNEPSVDNDSASKKRINAKDHWAYQPIAPVSVPNFQDFTNNRPGVSTNEIDLFLSVQQQSQGIEASPLISGHTLVRRLSIDLHGVRPDPDWLLEVAANDELLGAETIETMLASPRFGERFARHWMDAVRFAESITLRGFVLPDAWRYRNYLIESFNSDKPINQFIREQIAGDLVPSTNLSEKQNALIATTMLALGDTNLEEQDKKQLEMDYVDEQLDVIGKVFLAQTIGCARCHDHKFDPIPTSDYYALAGILKSSVAIEHANVSNWVRVPLPLVPEEEIRFKQLEQQKSMLKSQLEALKKGPSHSKESQVVAIDDLSGIVIDDAHAKKVGDWQYSNFVKNFVGTGYVHDQGQGKGSKAITFEPIEIEPGKYRVRMSYTEGTNRSKGTVVRVFSADGEDMVRVDQTLKPKDDGLWHTLGVYRFEQGGQAFVIVSNEDSVGHVTADAVQFLPESSADQKQIANASKSPSGKNAKGMSLENLEARLNEVQSELDRRPTVMSMRPSDNPQDLAIHIRGSVHQLGRVVPRGFLSCVDHSDPSTRIDAKSNGRLELAQWLASDENPLTARVYVNRVWGWLMGEGLVRTIDNFGTTGETPVNPQLLDWLTREFINHDWSTKWLVRKIVSSDAYKRSVRLTLSASEEDPDNRTFSHANRRRMDAETMRDSLMDISGDLDFSVGIGSLISQGLKDDYRYRHEVRFRSVYGPSFRNSPLELMNEFDGANASYSVGKRARSTVAPQALALLNSPWVSQRADRFAERVIALQTSDPSRMEYCFISILGRPPSIAEIDWAKKTLQVSGNSDISKEQWARLIHQLFASIDFRFID